MGDRREGGEEKKGEEDRRRREKNQIKSCISLRSRNNEWE